MGYAAGYAEALITVLERRGFHIDDAARARILEGSDLDRLQAWLGREPTKAHGITQAPSSS